MKSTDKSLKIKKYIPIISIIYHRNGNKTTFIW